MLQHSASLLYRNTLEPLDKFVNRGVVFEIFKKSRDQHARVPKDPRATQDGGVLFHSGAGRPINHAGNSSTALFCDASGFSKNDDDVRAPGQSWRK